MKRLSTRRLVPILFTRRGEAEPIPPEPPKPPFMAFRTADGKAFRTADGKLFNVRRG